jgi:hypothetical protein
VAYPIRVRPQVEGEIVEAMAWYELRAPGLGSKFYRTYLGVLRWPGRPPAPIVGSLRVSYLGNNPLRYGQELLEGAFIGER